MNRPLIKIWIFVLFFLPLTISLGFWQLDRSEEKQKLLSLMSHRFSSLPVTLSEGENMLPFKPYLLKGTFSNKTYLLDNRIRDGKVGYEVITPFYPQSFSDKWYVLVNRGWIKGKKYRDKLPEINTPESIVEIEGYFHKTDGKVPVLKQTEQELSWPFRIQQISWDMIKQHLTGDLLFENEFRLLTLEKDNVQPMTGIHYKVGWPRTSILPEKHTAYAYQWFALATTLMILALTATFKIRREIK